MHLNKAKEDFDSGDPERMRHVMKTMGAKLELLDRTVVFTPVKYLIPIKKSVLKSTSDSKTDRTNDLQGSNGQNGSNNSLWWVVRDLNPRLPRCKRDTLAS